MGNSGFLSVVTRTVLIALSTIFNPPVVVVSWSMIRQSTDISQLLSLYFLYLLT
ncbi:hypothetical protein M595_0045 [Lyngbya aestuarii BL J]|uniref:Uncharacterized protein n=1 Tax=Lyngbya aestuarii BL J TaxID=1348334 RepID=U7QPI2_9CYAN|nr:hypothetical protein M595_0045 [Lyngbya aestuarii BL J]